MAKITFSKVRWMQDGDGTWLCIHTPKARNVCDAVRLDKTYDIEIKQHRERRSLDANSYYWVLITKIAKKLRISNNRDHNIMLRRYGVPEEINNQLVYLVLPDVDEAEEKALESETYHIKPTSQVKTGKDGKLYRTYIMLKGSSAYDTAEMSRLINGIVDECKEMGIETIPPDKLKALLEVSE